MIDKRELRIGNWVSLKGKLNQMVPYDFVYWADKDFEPVVLTPDILVKAGFDNTTSVIWNYEVFMLYLGVNFADFYYHGHMIKVIHSLHELQNLIYTISGQELTINLK